jgi:hypothetical protein
VPPEENNATPAVDVGTTDSAAATSVVVGPLTVLVGGIADRAGCAVTKPGVNGLTIVTLRASADALGATFPISTRFPRQTGSPPRVSISRRGTGSATNNPSPLSAAVSGVNQPVMSTITWPPLRLNTSRPSGVTPTIVPLALVCSGRSVLTTDVATSSAPAGATETNPAATDSVAVTVTATAAASIGTPAGKRDGQRLAGREWCEAGRGAGVERTCRERSRRTGPRRCSWRGRTSR